MLFYLAASAAAFISFPGGPRSICGLGDVDKDGCADIAIGVGHAKRGGVDAGAVYVVSGKTGKQLAERVGSTQCSTFGTCLTSFRDFDGDGIRDFAVGAPEYGHDPCLELVPGSLFIVSGKDASILAKWKGEKPGDRFGYVLDAGGDFDRDSIADLIVGAPGFGDAHVLSGKDGRRIFSVSSGRKTSESAMSVCGLDDVDLDGTPDFAVGYPSEPTAGCVRVYSGKDGKLIESIEPGELALLPNNSPPSPYSETRFGCALAFVPDMEGPGKSCLLIGADHAQASGRAGLFSLRDRKRLRILEGTEWVWSRFGSSLDVLDDVNNDGVRDFVIADPDDGLSDEMLNGQAPGSAFLISGKNGETLFKVNGDKHHDFLGYAVAGCGDLNADGVPDFVAEAHAGGGETPYFRAYSGKDGTVLFQFDPPQPKPSEAKPGEKR